MSDYKKIQNIELTDDNSRYLIAPKQENIQGYVGQRTDEGGEIFNDYENNQATGVKSHAEGLNTGAIGEASHAEGYDTKAEGRSSHAEGYNSKATGINSHAEGSGTTASGYCSHAEGSWTTAFGDDSHAEGNNTTASGNGSHAEGNNTLASDHFSHAEGQNSKALGENSHAEGYGTQAINSHSHAEGAETQATGKQSHSEGYITIAAGNCAHAEGYGAKAEGRSSHAEGYNSKATGTNSHAEGYGTQATNNHSHAEGAETQATGNQSHSEGYITIAAGNCAHAEGYDAKAEGRSSHAEGYNSKATGINSHAEGNNTTASGDDSHAEGQGTIADGTAQHVAGKYNVADNTSLVIIGNGTSDTNRSNIITVSQDGADVAGNVSVNSLEIKTNDTGAIQSSTKIVYDDAINQLQFDDVRLGDIREVSTDELSLGGSVYGKGVHIQYNQPEHALHFQKNNGSEDDSEVRLTGIGAPTGDSDVTNKKYVDTELQKKVNNNDLFDSNKIKSDLLPSYVDDVIDGYLYNNTFYYDNDHILEIEPSTGKIYIDISNNTTYRWSGSTYVNISNPIKFGETADTAYAGDKGKANADAITTIKNQVGTYTLGANVPADAKFTDTTYNIASGETAGIVKIGYTKSGQNYPVELDGNNKMFVNVPWTDTNTTTSVNGKTGEVKDEILALINQQLGVIENGSY